ncbi:hypothetical protein MTO96_009127 [Rhipicephalus appendiculatus]
MLQTISARTVWRKPSAPARSLIRFEANGGSVSVQVARSLTAPIHEDNVCSPGSRARSHVQYARTVAGHPVYGLYVLVAEKPGCAERSLRVVAADRALADCSLLGAFYLGFRHAELSKMSLGCKIKTLQECKFGLLPQGLLNMPCDL